MMVTKKLDSWFLWELPLVTLWLSKNLECIKCSSVAYLASLVARYVRVHVIGDTQLMADNSWTLSWWVGLREEGLYILSPHPGRSYGYLMKKVVSWHHRCVCSDPSAPVLLSPLTLLVCHHDRRWIVIEYAICFFCTCGSHLNVGSVCLVKLGKKSCLIYSSPGAHRIYKSELENHPFIVLGKGSHKQRLTDGWMDGFVHTCWESELGLQASGLALDGRWTWGRFLYI